MLFLFTLGTADGVIEEQQQTGRKVGAMNEEGPADKQQRDGWELLGPSPLQTADPG